MTAAGHATPDSQPWKRPARPNRPPLRPANGRSGRDGLSEGVLHDPNGQALSLQPPLGQPASTQPASTQPASDQPTHAPSVAASVTLPAEAPPTQAAIGQSVRSTREIVPGSASTNEKVGNFPGAGPVSTTEPVATADPVNTDDQLLIDACLAGTMGAFDQLVVRYQDRLYNSLVRILGSADDARDVAQEAWIHAFHGLRTFRGNSAFYSWLFRIAFNAAASDRRKVGQQQRAASLDVVRERAGVEPRDLREDAEPSYNLEVSERQGLVQAALSELSEEYRTVLILKEMDDLRYEEIAEIIGCPIGTVRSRIHRARVELREKLRILFKEEGG